MRFRNFIGTVVIGACSLFKQCSPHRHGHNHGGPTILDLTSNTIENKYLWKCLDATNSSALYVINCDSSPGQTGFSLGFLQQNYDQCKNPIQVYGPGGTVLSWNETEHTIVLDSSLNPPNTEWCYEDSNYEGAVNIHPYKRPEDCLSAPRKVGNPITIISCRIKNDAETLGISWALYRTAPTSDPAAEREPDSAERRSDAANKR